MARSSNQDPGNREVFGIRSFGAPRLQVGLSANYELLNRRQRRALARKLRNKTAAFAPRSVLHPTVETNTNEDPDNTEKS